MEYRKVKKTGDNLSILGYGCMRLPEKSGRIDKKKTAYLFNKAIDSGINYFDTAFPYYMGNSENAIGDLLTKEQKNKIKIADKLTAFVIDSKKQMEPFLDSQLKRLKTDHIDYYLLHALDKHTWKKLLELDVIKFLEDAQKAGKIINIGFSFHDDFETFKNICDSYNWSFCQIQYNYLDENNQAGTKGFEYAASLDMGIMIMEPLRGGILARRVPNEVKKILEESEIKRTPAAWAFEWLWDKPGVNVVLSGMESEEILDENIRYASNRSTYAYTNKDREIIDKAKTKFMSLFKIGCTGCRYCMPCPFGVNIPSCFDTYNISKLHDKFNYFNIFTYVMRHGGLGDSETHYASQCRNCGKCVKKCPQHLDIPNLLKEVRNEFERNVIFKIMNIFRRIIAAIMVRMAIFKK